MQHIQEQEKHFNDDSMTALIKAFQMNVGATDAYMAMTDNGPRKSFIDKKIKYINQRVL